MPAFPTIRLRTLNEALPLTVDASGFRAGRWLWLALDLLIGLGIESVRGAAA